MKRRFLRCKPVFRESTFFGFEVPAVNKKQTSKNLQFSKKHRATKWIIQLVYWEIISQDLSFTNLLFLGYKIDAIWTLFPFNQWQHWIEQVRPVSWKDHPDINYAFKITSHIASYPMVTDSKFCSVKCGRSFFFPFPLLALMFRWWRIFLVKKRQGICFTSYKKTWLSCL